MQLLKKIGKFFLVNGYQAIILYRWAHFLENKGLHFLSILVHRVSITLTNTDIHPKAQLEDSVVISHGIGLVIGEGVIIGKNVMLRQNITIGQKGSDAHTVDYPVIGDNVIIGAGAVLIGSIHIGANSVIGANAVVTKDVPEGSICVGVPAKLIK